jgi:hypothetical protein
LDFPLVKTVIFGAYMPGIWRHEQPGHLGGGRKAVLEI